MRISMPALIHCTCRNNAFKYNNFVSEVHILYWLRMLVDLTEFTSLNDFVHQMFLQLTAAFLSGVVDYRVCAGLMCGGDCWL